MTDTQLAWPAGGYPRATSAPATPDRGSRQRPGHAPSAPQRQAPTLTGRDEWLTVDEVCAELNIGRRTFERWRALGIAPRATRPTRNGPLRIKRSWLEEWAEDGAN